MTMVSRCFVGMAGSTISRSRYLGLTMTVTAVGTVHRTDIGTVTGRTVSGS